MTIDPVLLARYLAQASELRGEVFLDSLTALEARRLVAAAARGASAAPADDGIREATPYAAEATTRAGAAAMTREQARARIAALLSPDAPPRAPMNEAPGSTAVAAEPPSLAAAGIPEENRALTVLSAEAQGCTRCGLAAGRTNVVFGEGAAHADVVVVGEAPGQEEDRTGRPFVGRAGKLLDLLLLSAGYPRATVYICNVLKCRPPGNRNPLPDEVSACTTSWLHAQLEAIAPKVVIAVGKFAAQTLCASEQSVGRLRGRIHDYNGTPLIATYHPAYLLRSPDMVRVAWQDFQLLRKVHDGQA